MQYSVIKLFQQFQHFSYNLAVPELHISWTSPEEGTQQLLLWINATPPIIQETKVGVTKLNIRKGAGPARIPAELFKPDIHETAAFIKTYPSRSMESWDNPQILKEGINSWDSEERRALTRCFNQGRGVYVQSIKYLNL